MKKKRKMTSVGVIEGNAATFSLAQTALNPSQLPSSNKKIAKKNKKIHKTQVSTSIMVILICVLSFFKSSIILISIIYASLSTGIVSNLLGTFSDYLIYAVTTLNFFIVLMFDRNFNQFFMKRSIVRMMCFKSNVGLRYDTSGSLAVAGAGVSLKYP
jgi:hypothetical protein